MIGYRIDGHDNDSYAFYGRKDVSRCTQCHELLSKWDEPLTGMKVKKLRKADISATYDGVLVVSHRFVQIYVSNHLTGLVFSNLPEDADFFKVESKARVEFDAEKAGTRFLNQCSKCGRYESVIGTHPFALKGLDALPARSFARTDLEFGSADEKHPVLVCDPIIGSVLRNARLRGLELKEI